MKLYRHFDELVTIYENRPILEAADQALSLSFSLIVGCTRISSVKTFHFFAKLGIMEKLTRYMFVLCLQLSHRKTYLDIQV